MKIKKIQACRICGNQELKPYVNFGFLSLTGHFPRPNVEIPKAPVELVVCDGRTGCGLVQLRHSVDPSVLYSNNYGYKSSLNNSMVEHLKYLAKLGLTLCDLEKGNRVVDIGANDGTFLFSFLEETLNDGVKSVYDLVAVDPLVSNFTSIYDSVPAIKTIPSFFPAPTLNPFLTKKKAKLVTSFAMLYDVEDPVKFFNSIKDILDDEGIWMFELADFTKIWKDCIYDVICHEHLTYYSSRQIRRLLSQTGFKLVHMEFNDINGGSALYCVAKKESQYKDNTYILDDLVMNEAELNMTSEAGIQDFEGRYLNNLTSLRRIIESVKHKGIAGIGASTKGNVVLQLANLTEKDIKFIVEVNPNKYECRTPGSNIPIKSELALRDSDVEYLLVLPWHFGASIMDKYRGRKFIIAFPTPHILQGKELPMMFA